MNRSFFEYLGMADMEKVHSQTLAWIFSENCHGLTQKDKNALFASVFRATEGSDSIESIQTEIGSIDIIISTKNVVIIIENKLKSFQHSNQLEKYKEYAEKRFSGRKILFFYLTLIPENIMNNKWHRLSYSVILEELGKINFQSNNHGVILQEYYAYLNRLVNITNNFNNNFKTFDLVFTDGKKRKEDKIFEKYENEQIEFIAKNQLETILQKFYLIKLADAVNHDDFFITDTRGDALINFHLRHNLRLGDNNYTTFIQFQGNLVKFAFAIEGDKYATSKKEWVSDVIMWMQSLIISEYNKYKFETINKPKSRAYISISRKIDNEYWKLNLDSICKELKEAIATGMDLTQELIEKSNGNISINNVVSQPN